MSPSFDAEDASVVKVDVRDPQSAARVGKFMVVVPPKVRARPRSPRGARGVERRIPRGIPVVCSIHPRSPPPLTPTLDPARAHPPSPPLTPPSRPDPSRERVRPGVPRRRERRAGRRVIRARVQGELARAADGGGVAIGVGPAIQAFTDNEVIVSFCGHLTNVDYLAWRLFSPEGRRGDQMRQHHANPLEAASALVGGRCYEAELICHMYKTFGTKALPKLRGEFAFACFDARSVRVFAARDPSGTYPLLYGRDDDGTVVVANFDGAAEVLRRDRGEADDDETAEEGEERRGETPKLAPVPAGCFIYGHRGVAPRGTPRTSWRRRRRRRRRRTRRRTR